MNRIKIGIKGKLILIFMLIKIIPLIILTWFAVNEINILEFKLDDQFTNIILDTKQSVNEMSELVNVNSIDALDDKSRNHIEYLTTITSRMVADFLYERDIDIQLASEIIPTKNNYKNFLLHRKRNIILHDKWCFNDDLGHWKGDKIEYETKEVIVNNKDNETDFHYCSPIYNGINKRIPLYLEMTFIDLNGKEQVKINPLDDSLRNISHKQNTYCNSEDYFKDIKKLKKDEIYVSEVIGEYKKSFIIGEYTKEKCDKAGIEFNPKQSAYAGKENPVGKKFQGMIRWITPVYESNKKIGYVTLALDHTHIMEFTDHIDPTDKIFTDISDASKGNYAFMWDYKGRNISHPRDYFIVGYNPDTGEQEVPWFDEKLYEIWENSDLSFNNFSNIILPFDNQSLDKVPSKTSIKNGLVALDGRYLNFAPQCSGWHNLTQHGGSGSFVIYWSGIWKLTTSAAIPYYTGRYGESKRGFGYVTIGANVEKFHQDAYETSLDIKKMNLENTNHLLKEKEYIKEFLNSSMSQINFSLSLMTAIMIAFVVLIAIWIATRMTDRIRKMIFGIEQFRKGDLEFRLNASGNDEISKLSNEFDDMAESLSNSMADLEKARLEAENSEKVKSLFLTNMSHEIRTPINGVLGLTNILSKIDNIEDQQEYLESLKISSEALKNVIDDILDFAKIESGKVTLAKIKFNIEDVITNTLRILQVKADEQELNLHYNIQEDVSKIYIGDSSRIQQILMNLVGNAIKFTNRGAVKITVKLKNITEEKTTLKISVIDQGLGISPNKQKIIFNAFEQVDNSYNRRYDGTGLGLSICSDLVELMNGEIGLDSKLGIGSTFWFIIELNNCDTRECKKDIEELKDLSFEGKNILLVEDNSINSIVTSYALKNFNLDISTASCGNEALIILERDSFNLILMDIQMPGMDGIETTKKIREYEIKNNFKRTPIVALTAHAMEEHREQCLEADMDDYMSKPFNNKILGDILVKWLIDDDKGELDDIV